MTISVPVLLITGPAGAGKPTVAAEAARLLRGANAALVPDLSDRGQVDRVAGAPVAAQRQPAGLPAAGGHLGRAGAVAGGDVMPAGEPGHAGTSPMMTPAMTGSAPNRPVTEVPEARTAVASFVPHSRR